MTITLPLQPGEEARLIAIAQAKGLSPDALVKEALDKILADLPTSPANGKDALQFNTTFWADQGEALEKRFAAWSAQ